MRRIRSSHELPDRFASPPPAAPKPKKTRKRPRTRTDEDDEEGYLRDILNDQITAEMIAAGSIRSDRISSDLVPRDALRQVRAEASDMERRAREAERKSQWFWRLYILSMIGMVGYWFFAYH